MGRPTLNLSASSASAALIAFVDPVLENDKLPESDCSDPLRSISKAPADEVCVLRPVSVSKRTSNQAAPDLVTTNPDSVAPVKSVVYVPPDKLVASTSTSDRVSCTGSVAAVDSKVTEKSAVSRSVTGVKPNPPSPQVPLFTSVALGIPVSPSAKLEETYVRLSGSNPSVALKEPTPASPGS